MDKVGQFDCLCADGWDGATCQNSESLSLTRAVNSEVFVAIDLFL